MLQGVRDPSVALELAAKVHELHEEVQADTKRARAETARAHALLREFIVEARIVDDGTILAVQRNGQIIQLPAGYRGRT